MKNFEYKTVLIKPSVAVFGGGVKVDKFNAEITQHSSGGWELVGFTTTSVINEIVHHILCVFKREIN